MEIIDWTTIITAILKWLLMLAVTAAGTAATAWLHKRKEREENATTDEARRATLDEAEKLVTTVVKYIKQTITSGIKGTESWTDQAQADAKAKAVSMFYSIMGESGMDLLSAMCGNVQAWVSAKIEAAILDDKKMDALIAAQSGGVELEPAEIKEGISVGTINGDSELGKLLKAWMQTQATQAVEAPGSKDDGWTREEAVNAVDPDTET